MLFLICQTSEVSDKERFEIALVVNKTSASPNLERCSLFILSGSKPNRRLSTVVASRHLKYTFCLCVLGGSAAAYHVAVGEIAGCRRYTSLFKLAS